MLKEILINATPQETRIAVLEDKRIAELFFERNSDKGIVGNVYKGKVVRVLPGMQAAFVDIGHERAAFLYAGDFYKSKHNADDLDMDDGENFDRAEHKRRKRGWEEVPPIAQLVREGQEILVQVAKGPIGTKGARLTCHVSLPGRTVVFMPTLKHNGVSRKIESYDLRRKLKKIIDQHRSKEGGFIVRTAASSGNTERQIKSDVDYLLNLWKKIERNFQTNSAPKLLHYDLDLTTRVIRDFLDDDVERVIIDSGYEHRRVLRFVRNFNPELREKIDLHEDPVPLFDRYHVEQEIHKALSKRVWLKSGGYLIIETTEALTSIDVNTGRFVGKKTLEETILKTNMEAAEEIVKQLRLRNIGGIIIIDFIDMERDSSKEQVYRFLEELLKDDKSRTTILKISSLGLVEMTRKRSRESVHRYLTDSCPTCEGKGFVKNRVSLAHQVLRDIRRELPNAESDHLFVTTHPEVFAVLKELEFSSIVALEKQFQKGIKLAADPQFHFEQIAIGQHPHGHAKPAAPMASAKRRPVETEEDDEDDEAAYRADLDAIKAAKEAKKRRAEEQAAAEEARREEQKRQAAIGSAVTVSVENSSDEEISDDPDLETPVMRPAEEIDTDASDEANDENSTQDLAAGDNKNH